jgi:hypothetical protein
MQGSPFRHEFLSPMFLSASRKSSGRKHWKKNVRNRVMTELNLNYENISVDYNAKQEDTAGGNTLGGGDIILTDLVGAAAAVETEILTSDGYIIVWDDLGAAAAAETGDFTENSPEGGTLILVDNFDSEQDYQTNADPYRQFNFTVELGDDASAGPADAYFVSTDASTVTESAPATGQEIGGGEGVTTHEYGHGISIRQVGGTEADDSFDFTPQPGNQEVPVPPDEIIIMPTCPPEQILDDRGYTDFLGQEGDSAAPVRGDLGGGDIILVDIVGSSSCTDDLGLI